ncbi:hypothetical protein [Myxococcus sp. AM010]|uniref:hypothetical protein n=1 Tax=Myxococcus sp. AM010 TaxID=2745138 RepID=UPI001595E65F|nr:hypothetical protein [Myxococcus sp. AM010]NVJ15183.1 hypothetical protein [Myxococcus sp. AM010]
MGFGQSTTGGAIMIKTRVSGNLDLTLPIECPSCGRKREIKARDAAPGTTVTCKGCGASIRLEGDDMRKAQKALDDLAKAFKRLGR